MTSHGELDRRWVVITWPHGVEFLSWVVMFSAVNWFAFGSLVVFHCCVTLQLDSWASAVITGDIRTSALCSELRYFEILNRNSDFVKYPIRELLIVHILKLFVIVSMRKVIYFNCIVLIALLKFQFWDWPARFFLYLLEENASWLGYYYVVNT